MPTVKQINVDIPISRELLKEGIFVTGTFIDNLDNTYYVEIPAVFDELGQIDSIRTQEKIENEINSLQILLT